MLVIQRGGSELPSECGEFLKSERLRTIRQSLAWIGMNLDHHPVGTYGARCPR